MSCKERLLRVKNTMAGPNKSKQDIDLTKYRTDDFANPNLPPFLLTTFRLNTLFPQVAILEVDSRTQ